MTQSHSTLLRLGETRYVVVDPAEDIRDHRVRDRSGDEIGRVDDLIIDRGQKRARFLLVTAGGSFLGIGEKQFLVPVDAITRIDPSDVHLDRTRDDVLGSPPFDAQSVSDDGERQILYASVYAYYGLTPCWSAGYARPTFPYYA